GERRGCPHFRGRVSTRPLLSSPRGQRRFSSAGSHSSEADSRSNKASLRGTRSSRRLRLCPVRQDYEGRGGHAPRAETAGRRGGLGGWQERGTCDSKPL